GGCALHISSAPNQRCLLAVTATRRRKASGSILTFASRALFRFAEHMAELRDKELATVRLEDRREFLCRFGRRRLGIARRQQDEHAGEFRAHDTRKIRTVHGARHHDVGEDQIDAAAAAQPFQRCLGVGNMRDLVAGAFEEIGRGLGNIQVILDEQDVHRRQRPRRNATGRQRLASLRLGGWKIERHRGPLADGAFEIDRTVRLTGEAISLTKAQTTAAPDLLGGEERLESALLHVVRHADAGVAHLDLDEVADEVPALFIECDITGTDAQRAAFRHRVARIEPDIEQRQLELAGVDLDRPESWRNVDDDADVAAQRSAEQIADGVELAVEIDALRAQRLPARESKQLSGERLAALGGVTDVDDQAFELLVVAGEPLGHIGASENDRQQIVEIVRDAPGQLSDGLHLLRLEQLLAGFLEPALRLTRLGNVARDLGKTDQLAIRITDRVDDDMRPEARAVLAQAPAFIFEFSLARRLRQVALRAASRTILRRKKHRIVLPKNFVGGIALDPLRAAVPADDRSVGVHQEDGIVGHRLDQELEAAFGTETAGKGLVHQKTLNSLANSPNEGEVPWCGLSLQADHSQPADDERGCKDADQWQRLLEHEHRDRRGEQDTGLAQRRHHGDRRRRHRPDNDAVGYKLQRPAGERARPIAHDLRQRATASAPKCVRTHDQREADEERQRIGIGIAGGARTYSIHQRISADGHGREQGEADSPAVELSEVTAAA